MFISLIIRALEFINKLPTVLTDIIGLWTILAVFYTLYIAAIQLYSDRNNLPKWIKIFALPILVVMLVCDFLMQITLFTILFLDIPRDLLVTARLKRYRDNAAYNSTWRQHVATLICTEALNPFDPSKHHC